MHTSTRLILAAIALLAYLTPNGSSAERRQGDTTSYKNITILRSADIPEDTSKRVATHVKANIPLKVSVLPTPIPGGEIEAKTHVANAKAAHKRGTPLVVLAGRIVKRSERVIISRKDSTILINVGAFQMYLKQPGKISDECLKRIDRAAMKAIGTLFGLDSCQNPFCAMSDHEAKPHIPLQGRNYCPACTPAFEEKVGLAPVLNKKPATKKKSSGK